MIYKISIFTDRKDPQTGQWTRTESGLESNQGMVAFANNAHRASKVAQIEDEILRGKEGCRVCFLDHEEVEEVVSVNVVKIWIDKETGHPRNHWFSQSSIYYFEK